MATVKQPAGADTERVLAQTFSATLTEQVDPDSVTGVMNARRLALMDGDDFVRARELQTQMEAVAYERDIVADSLAGEFDNLTPEAVKALINNGQGNMLAEILQRKANTEKRTNKYGADMVYMGKSEELSRQGGVENVVQMGEARRKRRPRMFIPLYPPLDAEEGWQDEPRNVLKTDVQRKLDAGWSVKSEGPKRPPQTEVCDFHGCDKKTWTAEELIEHQKIKHRGRYTARQEAQDAATRRTDLLQRQQDSRTSEESLRIQRAQFMLELARQKAAGVDVSAAEAALGITPLTASDVKEPANA